MRRQAPTASCGAFTKGFADRLRGKVLDPHRLNRIGRRESKYRAVKVQLRLEAPDDSVRLPEAVLLALEREVRNGQTLRAHGVGHHLRLVRRDDLVFQALEQNQRALEPVDEVNRRSSPV